MGRTRRDIIADNMRIALSRPEQPWRCTVCGTAVIPHRNMPCKCFPSTDNTPASKEDLP